MSCPVMSGDSRLCPPCSSPCHPVVRLKTKLRSPICPYPHPPMLFAGIFFRSLLPNYSSPARFISDAFSYRLRLSTIWFTQGFLHLLGTQPVVDGQFIITHHSRLRIAPIAPPSSNSRLWCPAGLQTPRPLLQHNHAVGCQRLGKGKGVRNQGRWRRRQR